VANILVFEQILLVIIVGAIAARVGRHFRIPEVLPLLLAGYVLGGDVLGLLKPDVLNINFETLALIAIPVILFVDGIKADPVSLRQRWKTLLSVSTLAVVVTVVGIAFVGKIALGMSWTTAFLLGAILSSTDPAAIIPLLRKLNINKRVSAVLEAETAFNDAAAITIFLVVLAQAAGGEGALNPAEQFFKLFVISIAVGLVAGLFVNTFFRRVRVEKDLMLISIVLLLATYAAAEYLGASGIISAVVAAILFGGYVRSHYVDSISRIYFFEAWDDLSFIATALVFLMLGSQLQLAALQPYMLYGLAITLAFVFLVRPLTILSSMFFDRAYSFKEKIFISWIGGPRGAVSAALASILVSKSYAGAFPAQDAASVLGITLTVIVASVAITSATASFAAKRLMKVSEDPLEYQYRVLSAELKTTMASGDRLKDDHKSGLINAKIFRDLDAELKEHAERIEAKMNELSEQKPTFEDRERASEIERLIAAQIDRLEDLYSKRELTEEGYRVLLEKNNTALTRLLESK
jgi:NhaP-type Na+/H+ or K+/H+ antiporter